MAAGRDDLRAECLARLGELPAVLQASITRHGVGDPPPHVVVLKARERKFLLRLLELRSHLGASAPGWLAAEARRNGPPTLVFAPYVSRDMGQRLVDAGVSYIDRVGNCHLDLDGGFHAHVEGRRPPATRSTARALRAPSLRIVFAWLARPELIDAPVRDVATAAGAGRSTVANIRRQLEAERMIVSVRGRRVLADSATLRERWLSAYATTLRPSLLRGRYETRERDPIALEQLVEAVLTPSSRPEASAEPVWAWGGGAAAWRLTGHWRREQTTLHHVGETDALLRALKALPARDGRLVILDAPGPVALDGPLPHVAHPLLVAAELLAQGDPRAAETAAEILERHVAAEPTS